MAKPSLKNLNAELEKEKMKKKETPETIVANPPRGERSDFLKLTVLLPPAMVKSLHDLRWERKSAGQKDTDISSLVRSSVAEYLKRNQTS